MTLSKKITLLARFEAKYIPEPNSGCWLWIGAVSRQGYGLIGVNRRSTRAHRISYQFAKGPIPQGLVLDHLCRVRCCVNPAHLEAVTQLENVRRGLRGAGPAMSAREAKRLYRQSPKGKASRRRESERRRLRKKDAHQ